MRRLLLAAVLVALVATGAVFANKPATDDGYAVDVKFSRQADGRYVCDASVTSAATGDVIFAPHVVAELGKPAVAMSENGDRRSRLEVQLDGTNRASVSLKITRAGAVVASQRTTVTIQ